LIANFHQGSAVRGQSHLVVASVVPDFHQIRMGFRDDRLSDTTFMFG